MSLNIKNVKTDLATVKANRDAAETTQETVESARRLFNMNTAVFVTMDAIGRAEKTDDKEAAIDAMLGLVAQVIHIFGGPREMFADMNNVLKWTGFPQHEDRTNDNPQA